jgi:hypothetical protein
VSPALILLAMGGVAVMTIGFFALMFRLGRFNVAPREWRSWAMLAALLVPWVLFLAFYGPLPIWIVLAMNLVVVAIWAWWWRTGRFSIERVPADVREEVQHRRDWMRSHRRLLGTLFAAYMLLSLVWAFAIVVIALVDRS